MKIHLLIIGGALGAVAGFLLEAPAKALARKVWGSREPTHPDFKEATRARQALRDSGEKRANEQ